ncbi:hypothetical protein ATJ93_3320 [Halopiger aswanensis]|uniref:Uncharacterized protein n=1 Tax=Halopiger aswanensis TaxID=148449 RepID=A0A3R7KJW1_9EURY|nr:hypothetical protein ATJ93_3320 [Halopiger aswanensis]
MQTNECVVSATRQRLLVALSEVKLFPYGSFTVPYGG